MNWYYVDCTIVQDTDIYHFDANTYDKYHDSIIGSSVRYTTTYQAHDKNIIPYKLVQIL